jgi:CheY-like chemotaxis protein
MRMIRARQPEILIMGLKMPRVDGFGVMEYLLAIEKVIPTIIVTAQWSNFCTVFDTTKRAMVDAGLRDGREYEILSRYRTQVFGFLPLPVDRVDFQNAVVRCEEFRRGTESRMPPVRQTRRRIREI